MTKENYEQRFQTAVTEARAAGLNILTIDVRLLRKMGIKAKPRHYTNWIQSFFQNSVYFSFVWGLWMYFFIWKETNTIYFAITISLLAGALYGVFMAIWASHQKTKYNLRQWDDL